MTKITLSIDIAAPLQEVFDLARDAGFHVETARRSGERIVAGRASGRFELGDEVTFEARHLGVRQRLGARIVAMDAPRFFADEMTRGVFKSLRHEHHFEVLPDETTRMTDVLLWRSPLGMLGVLADALAVKRHLRGFCARAARRSRRERSAMRRQHRDSACECRCPVFVSRFFAFLFHESGLLSCCRAATAGLPNSLV